MHSAIHPPGRYTPGLSLTHLINHPSIRLPTHLANHPTRIRLLEYYSWIVCEYFQNSEILHQANFKHIKITFIYHFVFIFQYSDMLFWCSNIIYIFMKYSDMFFIYLEILSRTTCCWMPGVMSNCQILGFAPGWRNLTGLTSIVIFPKSSRQISPPTPWTPRGKLRAGRGTDELWRTLQ